jgi:hypothetical protein
MEAEGLATVTLGSQRNQIVTTAPPRGLWYDFALGRPLGRPGDAEFQHRVLKRAFGLLTSSEPIVDVFPRRPSRTAPTSSWRALFLL